MKTPNEIKDEVAKSHGYDSWDDLLDCVEVKITRRPVLIQLENEAMEAYAQQKSLDIQGVIDYVKDIEHKALKSFYLTGRDFNRGFIKATTEIKNKLIELRDSTGTQPPPT